MSASPSPPNPGQPKRTPNAPPPPSVLRRATPGLLAGGAALTLAWVYFRASPNPAPNPLHTPGVSNIEKAYRGAGATGTHTPAYGGTEQGERNSEAFRGDAEGTQKKDGPPEAKSAGKREFKVSGPNDSKDGPRGEGSGSNDIGEVQRPPGSQAMGAGKLWNRAKYGNEDQK
ncbi:hypothetical protein EPUS_06464 [Endocarpon pusillum Z07020]|uniref:Uncharacterized protein n=1 Tax=Endocarpon pusillum (strain Z07020 / HMAS-L-300199) TaxID=1263415 RepID=U1I4Y5_ENDPU|nr:uncharacterized protein EPUS_06464 [Endocarpon pusillum Z07020]ERF77184.1 hypothetical protein EPUS_06464 [Endocarpon pusillum Z07020]